ncbi:MAG: hypothetical protein L0H83_12155, partial [Salinisphaera sp.]|nr:hypothetical protein [Salinisphaera sp.]
MRAWFGVLLSVSLLAGCQNLPAIFTSDTSGPPPDYVNVLRTGNVLIQLVPRAPQAPPNNHPAAFAPEQLHALLMSLRIRSEGEGAVTLASPSRLTSVAEGLAKAFARARPDQDIFLVFFRRKAGNLMFSSHRQATSARVFFRNDTLQFIFDELDHYFSSFRGPQTNKLEPGRRDTAQGVKGARL